MKQKSVSTIDAILCGTLLAFAVFSAAFAQTSASGDTFPKTTEEIKLVEDLIMSAKYDLTTARVFNVKITFETPFFLLKNRLFVLSLQRLQISFRNL